MVTCSSCGTSFVTGSTVKHIAMEVCSSCHPFYTGEQRFIDAKGRVEKFQKKQETAQAMQKKLQEKKAKKSGVGGERQTKSLKELLAEN